MIKFKKFFHGILIIIGITATLFYQINCCSIIHGTRQEISVNSQPIGVKVIVKGVHMATTPAVIEFKRKESNIILRFEKEGYEPVEVALRRSTDGWIAGNIIFGGLIGLVVDFANGAAYKLSPADIQVELKKLNISIEDLPRDGTVIAVDLESIKN